MKNTSGLARAERKELRRAKKADRLATLDRYWVFIRKPNSQYTRLVARSAGHRKSQRFNLVGGVVTERTTVYAISEVF